MKEICSVIFRTPLPMAIEDEALEGTRRRTEDKILDFHPDVKQPSADPSWPLLEAAYNSLFNVLTSDGPDTLFLEGFVDESFVRRLLDNLLDSGDPREAKSIGKILPEIWSLFDDLQGALWMGIIQTISRFLVDSKNHIGSGVWELLMFLSERIDERPCNNLFFLLRMLIRLHKPTCFAEYNQPLTLCFRNILEEDDDLTDYVILGILRHWPTKLPSKEALMLREIRDILLDVPVTQVVRSVRALFKRLDSCLRSEHYLVVRRALEILDLPAFRLIAKRNKILLPLFSAGLEVATEHWMLTVMERAIEVHRTYRQIDQNPARKRMASEGNNDDQLQRKAKLTRLQA